MNDTEIILSAGRFANIEFIGRGATANVYRADDSVIQSEVALKVIHPQLVTDPVSLERFKREIRIARHLNHPQIAAVYELLDLSGRLCLVMERIGGESLKTHIQLNHPIPMETVLSMIRQTASVLSDCHQKNVIHRDLNPRNIFISKDGSVRLLDFGIARMTEMSDLTKTGVTLGTPEYMAPELFASNSYDPRTDIYSLGVIAFQLLAGRLPFQGDSVAELLNLHINTPVPDVLKFRSDTPTFLKQVVEKLLEKKPVNRYQCMDELLLDLESGTVMTKHFPELSKRVCIQCGENTPVDLPFCSFCGFSLSDAISRAGEYRIVRSRAFIKHIPKEQKSDNKKLKRFIKDTFDLRVQWFNIDRDVLIAGVDEFLAGLVCKRAWDYGVLLKSEKPTALKTTLAHINFIFRSMPFIFISFLSFLYIIALPSIWATETEIFPKEVVWMTPLIILISLWLILLKLCVTAPIFPVIGRETMAKSPFMKEAEFWKEVANLLKQQRTDEMKTAVAESISLSVMLGINKGCDARDDGKSGIYDILKRLVSVANLISSVERSLSKTDRANLSGKEPEKKLKQHTEMTDRYGELTNSFFQLRFALNRIAGKTQILNNALNSFEIADLAQNLEALEKSFRTLEKVRLEMEKI